MVRNNEVTFGNDGEVEETGGRIEKSLKNIRILSRHYGWTLSEEQRVIEDPNSDRRVYASLVKVYGSYEDDDPEEIKKILNRAMGFTLGKSSDRKGDGFAQDPASYGFKLIDDTSNLEKISHGLYRDFTGEDSETIPLDIENQQARVYQKEKGKVLYVKFEPYVEKEGLESKKREVMKRAILRCAGAVLGYAMIAQISTADYMQSTREWIASQPELLARPIASGLILVPSILAASTILYSKKYQSLLKKIKQVPPQVLSTEDESNYPPARLKDKTEDRVPTSRTSSRRTDRSQ